MANPKYKIGDMVRIVSNDLQRNCRGKVGKVKKVFESFSDFDGWGHQCLYRIEVDGEVLRGVAFETDLEMA